MNAKERLLLAVVELQHYIKHDTDHNTCAACPRWNELQSAALAIVDQREWVGLTDEEVDEFCNGWLVDGFNDIQDFVEAIASELKEKNA